MTAKILQFKRQAPDYVGLSFTKYIMDEYGIPKIEPDLMKWAAWYEQESNVVIRRDMIDEASEEGVVEVSISTVFLSIDHAFYGGKPVLFETMIFGGKHDLYQERCHTKAEAVEQHQKACSIVGGDKLRRKDNKSMSWMIMIAIFAAFTLMFVYGFVMDIARYYG